MDDSTEGRGAVETGGDSSAVEDGKWGGSEDAWRISACADTLPVCWLYLSSVSFGCSGKLGCSCFLTRSAQIVCEDA